MHCKLLHIFVAICLFVCTVHHVESCSCGGVPHRQHYFCQDNVYVIRGYVDSEEDMGEFSNYKILIEEEFKELPPDAVDASEKYISLKGGGMSSCAVDFAVGSSYELTLYYSDGSFSTDICSNHPWDTVSDYVKGYYRNDYVSCECEVTNALLPLPDNGIETEGNEEACFNSDDHQDGVCYKVDGICTWDKILLV